MGENVNLEKLEEREPGFREEKRKEKYAYAGAIVGFIVVKVLFFNALEDMGWHLFWSSNFENLFNFQNLKGLVTTSGFIKLAVGTIIGFELGKLLGSNRFKKFIDDVKKEMEQEDKNEK